MRLPVIKVGPQTKVEEAVDLLLKHDLSGLPVTDEEGHLLGMFSELDQMTHLHQSGGHQTVVDFMTRDVASVEIDEPIVDVARKFRELAVHRLPVLKNNQVVGIIGCRDVVRFVRKLETTRDELVPLIGAAVQSG